MQGSVYGRTNNNHYSAYIRNDDELPRTGYHAKDLMDHMFDIKNGGNDPTVYKRQQFFPLNMPLRNQFGNIKIIRPAQEGSYGETFGQLTSAQKVENPLPASSTFMPQQYVMF